jgi:CRISPR-associated protein Csh2
MTLDNRSELLLLYDAQDCNPNGNPLGDNRPRRDTDTGQGIITDVRLKRYLRDQLLDDGYDIYVKKLNGVSRTRTQLIKNVLGGVDDAETLEDMEEVGDEFLKAATDVRYFGATLSFEAQDNEADEKFRTELNSALPNNYQGPVQFLPSKSLNKVEENDEYDSLTSVISTGEENRQGGFALDDKRIKYGLFPFYGLVDENGAKSTRLSENDVQRLDTLCWRALKNQTMSRSKLGQEPRLYIRVEFADESYHIGGLHSLLELGEESRESLRSIDDVVVDATRLVSQLNNAADRIDTVHIVGDSRLSLTVDGESLTAADLGAHFERAGHSIHEIDVIGERDLAA